MTRYLPPGPGAWLARLGLAAALVVALVLAPAGPASAHATLLQSDPAEGQVLEVAPEQIAFVFSEGVAGVPDGVQVFDARGVEVPATATVRGAALDVVLDGPIADGTLIVLWRVVSADGHPITGSLSFAVGAPSESVTAPPAVPSAGTEAPWSLSLVRWAGYLGLLLAAGLVAFAVLVLPAGRSATDPPDRVRRRLVGLARAGAVAAALGWLVVLPLTATYQLGTGLGSMFSAGAFSTLSVAEYAVTAAVVGGVVLGVALLAAGRDRPALAAVSVAVLAPALTGHTRAAVPELLAIGADALHLAAGSVWLGGLVALALTLPDLAGRGTRAAQVLTRFSTIAASLLAVLVLTGTLLAWRIAGSWATLLDSGYGRLLLVKVAVALVAVLIAGWNRWRLLGPLQHAARRRDRVAAGRVMVRAVSAEAAVLAAVLAVTGFLVDTTPESDAEVAATAAALERSGPGVVSATVGEIEVRLRVGPRAPGPNTLDLELLDATGQPAEGFQQLRVRLASDEVDLGALDLDYAAPGRYRSEVILPSAGTWRLQVSLRISEFENPVAGLDFEIGG